MIRFIVLFVAMAFTLTGCLEYETRIKIRTDGSGTITETLKVNEETADFLQSMDEQSEGKSVQESLFDKEKLRKEAADYGEGVSLVSATELNEMGKIGYKAVYAFPDIEKLVLQQNSLTKQLPGGNNNEALSSEEDGTPSAGEAVPGEEQFKLTFTKGDPALLRIKLFDEEELKKKLSEQSDKELDEEPEPEEEENIDSLLSNDYMRTMRMFMEGLKMNIIVEADGKIIETNASYREGSAITLMGIDFDELLSDDKKLKSFIKTSNALKSQPRPQTSEELQEFLKRIPGFKMEFKEVLLKFTK